MSLAWGQGLNQKRQQRKEGEGLSCLVAAVPCQRTPGCRGLQAGAATPQGWVLQRGCVNARQELGQRQRHQPKVKVKGASEVGTARTQPCSNALGSPSPGREAFLQTALPKERERPQRAASHVVSSTAPDCSARAPGLRPARGNRLLPPPPQPLVCSTAFVPAPEERRKAEAPVITALSGEEMSASPSSAESDSPPRSTGAESDGLPPRRRLTNGPFMRHPKGQQRPRQLGLLPGTLCHGARHVPSSQG